MWFPFGPIRPVRDIPTCNIAYKRQEIANHYFIEGKRAMVYEDALFNAYLIQRGKKIIFNPRIAVVHHKWNDQFSKADFLRSQKRYALGFVYGGYAVHGIWGVLLMRLRWLNMACLRLVCVAKRCLCSKGYFSKFIKNIKLIVYGEYFRGKIINYELVKKY